VTYALQAPHALSFVLYIGTACATNVALVVSIRIFPPTVTGQVIASACTYLSNVFTLY
jgi:hypothetical protein